MNTNIDGKPGFIDGWPGIDEKTGLNAEPGGGTGCIDGKTGLIDGWGLI